MLQGGALQGGTLQGGALQGGALQGGALQGGALQGVYVVEIRYFANCERQFMLKKCVEESWENVCVVRIRCKAVARNRLCSTNQVQSSCEKTFV